MHAASCLILLTALAAGSDNWPAFQGAGVQPPAAEALPLKWSPESNIAWTSDLPGYGQSSPIVWNGKVYITSIDGPNKETNIVTCWNLADGAALWRKDFKSSLPIKSSTYVSRAAPTPTVDQLGVYAFFESGDIIALSHDGEQLWSKSLIAEYGEMKSNHGLGASPALTDNAVVLLVENDGPSYLVALDKKTGEAIWKTDRESKISWSSPRVIKTPGGPQIVISSSGTVDGYDVDSGKQLWSIGDLGGNTTNTPMPYGDGLFLVGASAGRGEESGGGAKRSNMAVRVRESDAGPTAEVLWRNEKASSSFSTPIVHQGVAYWVNKSGVVFGVDAESGETLFTERLGQSCWATSLGVGDRVYFFGKEGLTTVVKAGPKWEVLAENTLWDEEAAAPAPEAAEGAEGERRGPPSMSSGPVLYGYAAVPGKLLIRTGPKLYCITP
ncbi:outer membrane protein assembly factor BamB family protein [Blastopirellula marina]|uniref:Serine/threonine protein kinase related protein-like n=1 Tax=Blastopirellula marina DSM 3645 TaxID=314230 RepID=A3ZN12_9BACT|nr:PQQ-binding-like beta-propeller repeat protein [Blastopirellula marina]EAQ82341.1 serine/threonine protein kinase related protein-like [Blastopirellula marina DSM 3645]